MPSRLSSETIIRAKQHEFFHAVSIAEIMRTIGTLKVPPTYKVGMRVAHRVQRIMDAW